jgi:hypothetical protein
MVDTAGQNGVGKGERKEKKKRGETRNEKARGICIKSTFEAKHSLVFRE